MIVGKTHYSDKMENYLNDTRKFQKINLRNDGLLSFAVNQEKRVDNIFKRFVVSKSISEETRYNVWTL